MKSSRLIATVLLLLIALVCFISTPVFSLDPWDSENRPGSEDPGGNGSDGDGSDDPGDVDPNTDQGMDQTGNGSGPDWLTGLASTWTFDFVTYLLGAEDDNEKSNRDVVEEGSGNATAQ